MSETSKEFSSQERAEAVRHVIEEGVQGKSRGKAIKAVALEIGCDTGDLNRWIERSEGNFGWRVEDAAKLVEAVEEAGGELPSWLQYPGEDAGYRRLRDWQDAMGELAESVSFSFTLRDANRDLTDEGRARGRVEKLSKIIGQTHRLKSNLEKLKLDERNDDVLISRLDQALPIEYPSITEFLSALLEVAKDLRERMEAGPPVQGSTNTPQAALIGSLADAYAEHFDASPSIGLIKTFNDYGGPFPAFVRATLEIQKEPMSPVALTMALMRHFLK